MRGVRRRRGEPRRVVAAPSAALPAGTVLARNHGALLPLSARSLRHVALIGAAAEPLRDALASALPRARVDWAPGAHEEGARGAGRDDGRAAGAHEEGAPDAGRDDRRAAGAGEHGPARRADAGRDDGRAAGARRDANADAALQALDLADDADVAIAVGATNALVHALSDAKARTVAIVDASAAGALPWLAQVPAVLIAERLGDGAALAALLLGATEPRGRLARAWPDFPLGHGLGYTSWDYLGVEPTADGVRVHVVNSGTRRGAEAIQLYAPGALDRPLAVALVEADADERLAVEIAVAADARGGREPDARGGEVSCRAAAAGRGPRALLAGRSAGDLRAELAR